METTKRQKSFAAGALVLMLANLTVKIIGALLKIPLTNLVGLTGMAYYNTAYQIYALLFLLSTSGLPVAVSRLVAKSSALGRKNEVKRIFKLTVAVFACVGIVGTIVIAAGSGWFASLSKMPLASRALVTVSPTIFLICIVSAIRGYFQGLQNMVPTAISQLIEAVLKLAVGYTAAAYAMSKGYPVDVVAAYAISGVTVGVLVSTVFLVICYILRGKNPCEMRDTRSRSNEKLVFALIKIALPVALTAAALYLANIVDLMTIVNMLEPTFGQAAAEMMYSAYSSISITLANMPSTIIYAIATSVLPALAAAIALKQMKKVRESMRAAVRLTLVFALPCAFGIGALSRGIISCVYSAETIGEIIYTTVQGQVITALDVSAGALTLLAFGIVFITLYSTTNALMQSYGLEWYTILSVISGTATKLVLALILLSIPALNIYGAAISTVACYIVAVSMNCHYLKKKTGHPLKLQMLVIKPFFAGAACGLSAFAVYSLIMLVLGQAGSVRMRSAVGVVGAIIVGAAVYFVVLMLLRGMPMNELLMLPKGEKICAFLKKVRLLKDE